MTTFGKAWDRHIHYRELCGWYKLWPELQHEVDTYQPKPEDVAALTEQDFAALMKAVRAYTDNSVTYGGRELPTHNCYHFEAARQNGLHLFDRQYGLRATSTWLFVRQALEIALYMHDCHHCGSTLRIDSTYKLHLPKLGKRVAVEYVSAVAANDFLRGQNVPLPWRVFVVGIIFASTFGHSPAVARGLTYIPNPQPKTFYHALMRVADVQPMENFKASLEYGALVNLAEIPATGADSRIKDAEGLVQSQLAFLGYVSHTHQQLERLAPKLCHRAGFHNVVTNHTARLKAIAAGRDPEGMRYAEELVRIYS
jgi:hypothetical protein